MTRQMFTRLVAVATAALLTVSGCTGKESTGREPVPTSTGSAPVPTSSDLYDKISELRSAKKTAPLKSLTDFSWDGVFCYYEGAPTDEINAAVGGPVEQPGRRLAVSGALAIFVQDGKPVRKARIPEINFKIQRYSQDVLVKDGFELVEPD